MTMHEFGPWKIESRPDMRHLSRFMLAVTMRADVDAREKESRK